jgi:hypothetical protein
MDGIGRVGPRVKVYQPARSGLDTLPSTLKTVIPRLLTNKLMADLPFQISVNFYPSGQHGMVVCYLH